MLIKEGVFISDKSTLNKEVHPQNKPLILITLAVSDFVNLKEINSVQSLNK